MRCKSEQEGRVGKKISEEKFVWSDTKLLREAGEGSFQLRFNSAEGCLIKESQDFYQVKKDEKQDFQI